MLVYFKLILKNIITRKKKSVKFITFLAVCFLAIIFSFTLGDSFYSRYIDLACNMITAHLAVVSEKHPESNDRMTGIRIRDLPLISVDEHFKRFVASLPETESATSIIETNMNYFTIEGDSLGSIGLIGINPADFLKLLPARTLLDGTLEFTAYNLETDIPVLRKKLRNSQRNRNYNIFLKSDIKVRKNDFDIIKKTIINDFPVYFKNTDKMDMDLFLKSLNEAIKNDKLYQLIPEKYFDEYSWELDDNIAAIENHTTNVDIRWLNKKLLQSVYPKIIKPVRYKINLDAPLTMLIPPAKVKSGLLESVVLPIKFVGYIETMPLFTLKDSFIDIKALQFYLELAPDQCTRYMIRLKDKGDVDIVKQKLESYFDEHNSDYRVIDYKRLGILLLPIASSFRIITFVLIIIILFVITLFISNFVLLMIMKRKKEIGTSITLGMSKKENIFIFTGEIFVLTTAAWIIGSVSAGVVILSLSKAGMPGMLFFVGGKLHLDFNFSLFLLTYLISIVVSVISALLSSLSILKFKLIMLLRDPG